jgi:hypothetical protein
MTAMRIVGFQYKMKRSKRQGLASVFNINEPAERTDGAFHTRNAAGGAVDDAVLPKTDDSPTGVSEKRVLSSVARSLESARVRFSVITFNRDIPAFAKHRKIETIAPCVFCYRILRSKVNASALESARNDLFGWRNVKEF